MTWWWFHSFSKWGDSLNEMPPMSFRSLNSWSLVSGYLGMVRRCGLAGGVYHEGSGGDSLWGFKTLVPLGLCLLPVYSSTCELSDVASDNCCLMLPLCNHRLSPSGIVSQKQILSSINCFASIEYFNIGTKK